MSDIIERDLALRILAEDLSSDVFASIAENLDALQERFETTFEGMASYAEDAASEIGDAANVFVGPWVEQLTSLDSLAADTFASIGSSAAAAAAAGASSASDLFEAWAAQLAAISAESEDAAGEIDAALAGAGESSDANGSALAEDWTSNFDRIAAGADDTAGEIDAALDSVGADGATNGTLLAEDWSTNLDKVATDAEATATKVDASLDGIGANADANGADVSASWGTNLDKVTADAELAAGKVDASLDGIGADGASNGSVLAADWESAWSKIVEDAQAGVTKVNGAFTGIDTDATTAGDKMVTTFSADFDKIVADADAAAGKVDAALGGTAIAGGAVTGGSTKTAAGEVTAEDVAAADAEGVSIGSILGKAGSGAASAFEGVSASSILSTGLMGTILGTLGLAGASQSVSGVQGIGFLGSQLGEGVPKALQTYLASSAVGSDANLEKLFARLENSLQKVELQGTPELQGAPVSIGLGRQAVEPESLKALLETGSISSQAAGLALLFGSPKGAAAQLQGDDPTTQLALIASKLDDIKNANERTQIASDLFGARSGVSALPLLQDFQKAMGIAGKDLSSGSGATFLKDLEQELGGSGKTSMMQYQEQSKLTEVGLETSLVKLTPTLEKVEIAVDDLIAWLDKQLGKGGAVKNAADFINNPGDKSNPITHAMTSGEVPGTDQWWMNQVGLHDTQPPSPGPATSFSTPLSGGATSFLEAASKQGYTTTQLLTMKADIQAADKYNLNPLGLIASQINESGLLPNRYAGSSMSSPTVGSSAHTGLAQFAGSTWAADYEATYGRKPASNLAANYSADIQANVEAHTLKAAGLDRSGNPLTAAYSIDSPAFENAGAGGNAADRSAALQFLTGFGAKELSSPLAKGSQFERVDQGVDYDQSSAYKAIASGVITAITHGFHGGSDTGVYETLSKPIDVNGRSYSQAYYAETDPLVKVGQRVAAGQAVTAGGAAELGFASGNHPAAPLVGGLGEGTKPSQAGQDFLTFVKQVEGAMTHASSVVKQHAPEIPKAIATELNTMLDEAKKADLPFVQSHQKMVDDALKLLEAKVPMMTTSGHGLMEGLLKGIQDEEGPLRSEAEHIASEIEATLNAALKIKSPSELTAEMGEHLVAGLGLGMRRGAASAAAEGAGAALKVAGGLGGGLGGLGGGVTHMVIEMPIQLDGQQIGRTQQAFTFQQMKLSNRMTLPA